MKKQEILELAAAAFTNNENPKKKWIVDVSIDYSRVSQSTGITIYIIDIDDSTIFDSFRSYDYDEDGNPCTFEDAKSFLKKYTETGD